jgi:hypothetical protein
MTAREFVSALKSLGLFYDAIFQLEYDVQHDVWVLRLWTQRPTNWVTHAIRITGGV